VSHRKHRARSNNQGDRYGAVAGDAYNENAHDFVASGRVEAAARDARRAVDGPESAELHAAEEAGKARAHMSKTEYALAFLHRLSRAARAAIHELRN
jgi:hypothetical protein